MYSLGDNTLKVSAELHRENRARLVAALKGKVPAGSVVLLKGGVEDEGRYNTDMTDVVFRQESYFFWAFGVHESAFFGLLDLDTGKSVLFAPRLDPSFAIWDGKINNEEYFKNKYLADEVHFNDANVIPNYLKSMGAKQVVLLRADNSDSGNILLAPDFEKKAEFTCDEKILYPIMAELRVFKTDRELEVLRYAAKIACEAHRSAMKNIKQGIYEYQMESVFRHVSYYHGGCRHLAYTCVAASGDNSSVLHYGHANAPNNKEIKDGDMCLFDMGPEYDCYTSDVTTSFPANGKFTEKQKMIYNAVLDANITVFKAAKPGVKYTEMHLLAEHVILNHLKNADLVIGDVDEMVRARIGAVFMPHGLGHFIGCDVHDCGGYMGDAPPRSTEAGLSSLRVTRSLQERMTITIEPGCYFVDTLLNAAFANPAQAKYLNKEKIDQFRGFGGVRIEDDVVIWAKGNENMSHDLPRTVDEIEKFMAEVAHDDESITKSIATYLHKH